MRRNYFSIIFLLFLAQKISAQHTLLLIDGDAGKLEYYSNNLSTHSSLKPLIDVDLDGQTYKILDSSIHYPTDKPKVVHEFYSTHAVNYSRLSFHEFYARKEEGPNFDDNKIPINRNAAILVRPLYEFNIGNDFNANRILYSTTGGAIIDADYKQKIGIEIRFATGTTVLPNYLDSITTKTHVMPGWGDRAFANGNGSYSFQHISGNLIWRPLKIFNLQVGRDKHFWGDGYRSLFLSDVSGAMPYLKQTTSIWKLQYTSLFTWMQDWSIAEGVSKNFRSKFGTFHYISFNANKWLNIGVFESVIWQGNDTNRTRGFDPNYLVPVVFFRPIEYSLGSSDNAMLGLSLKFRVNANNQFYTQLILDEFYLKEILAHSKWWANKQGLQLGYKCFNLGHVENLFFQAEMNIVRPYTYTHGSVQQNYSNAGMALAHPLGANFLELIGRISYPYKQFYFAATIIASSYGLDPAGKDFGQNIFLSYMDRSAVDTAFPNEKNYNHKLFDGIRTNMFYAEVKVSYKMKTAFPIRFELVAAARNETNELLSKKSGYIQLGISLPLWKANRDY